MKEQLLVLYVPYNKKPHVIRKTITKKINFDDSQIHLSRDYLSTFGSHVLHADPFKAEFAEAFAVLHCVPPFT